MIASKSNIVISFGDISTRAVSLAIIGGNNDSELITALIRRISTALPSLPVLILVWISKHQSTYATPFLSPLLLPTVFPTLAFTLTNANFNLRIYTEWHKYIKWRECIFWQPAEAYASEASEVLNINFTPEFEYEF